MIHDRIDQFLATIATRRYGVVETFLCLFFSTIGLFWLLIEVLSIPDRLVIFGQVNSRWIIQGFICLMVASFGTFSFATWVIQQKNQELVSHEKELRIAQDAAQREQQKLQSNWFSLNSSFEVADVLAQLDMERKEIVFWGTTFSTLVPALRQHLQPRIQAGMSLQALLISDNAAVVHMAGFRANPGEQDKQTETIFRDLRNTSNILADLQAHKGGGAVHYYCLDYLPSFTLVGFDLDSPDGFMFVRFSELLAGLEFRPTITLSRRETPKWFEHFRKQWILAHNAASVMDPSGDPANPGWQRSDRRPSHLQSK